MAHAYTTKRGKNKKGKLGDRKDAANNAANKLSQKMFAENPLEFLSKQSLEPKTLGNSATARRRDALEAARASLNLLLTGSCGNKECTNGATREDREKLLLCQGCRQKAYCNAECQKADWNAHKAACKEAKAKKAAEEEAAKQEAAGGKKKGPEAPVQLALEAKPDTNGAPAAAAAAAAPAAAAAAPAAAAAAASSDAAASASPEELD